MTITTATAKSGIDTKAPSGKPVGRFPNGRPAFQPAMEGGIGLGTVDTSMLFVVVILGLVTFLTVTKKDQLAVAEVDSVEREGVDDEEGTESTISGSNLP